MAYVNINNLLDNNSVWSGGELNLRIDYTDNFNPIDDVLVARLQNSEDIIRLIMTNNIIKTHWGESVDVVIPYLPYARQDRICFTGEPFSLKVFADMINRCEFNSVTSFDVHSNVAELLINNFVNIKPDNFVKDVIDYMFDKDVTLNTSNTILVSPDVGAFKKVESIAFNLGLKHLPCIKTRDSFGNISNIQTTVDMINNHCKYLIVDDICDGGRTFASLAQFLTENGAYDIDLCVSHGIFSHGTDLLIKAGIKDIFNTDTWDHSSPDDIIQNIEPDFDFLNYL